MEKVITEEILKQLEEPMDYQWRIGQVYGDTATCLPYIDARDVMDRLDKVVGKLNWKVSYYQVKNTMFGRIAIKVGNDWIEKDDAGAPSDIEAEKGEASDALKRSGVVWGIGRFLYSLDMKKVKVVKDGNKTYPVDESGERIWNLTEYINNRVEKPKARKPAPYSTGEIAKPCSECTTACTVAETGYSTKTFGRPLCRNCQAKLKSHDIAPL